MEDCSMRMLVISEALGLFHRFLLLFSFSRFLGCCLNSNELGLSLCFYFSTLVKLYYGFWQTI